MDLSLEDFIKQTKPARGRGGRGGRRGAGGGGGMTRASPRGTGTRGIYRNRIATSFTRPGQIPDGRWEHDRFEERGGRMRGGGALTTQGATTTTKLLISNLDYGVSDSDVLELFNEFGPVRRAAVHYDKSGRSLGSADVVFERRVDAARAMKQYNNIPLDGRPMKIQMVGPGTGAEAAVARTSISPQRRLRDGAIGRGAGAGRGRGRGAGRGGGRRMPPPSAEDLDAELDAYVNKMDAE